MGGEARPGWRLSLSIQPKLGEWLTVASTHSRSCYHSRSSGAILCPDPELHQAGLDHALLCIFCTTMEEARIIA